MTIYLCCGGSSSHAYNTQWIRYNNSSYLLLYAVPYINIEFKSEALYIVL